MVGVDPMVIKVLQHWDKEEATPIVPPLWGAVFDAQCASNGNKRLGRGVDGNPISPSPSMGEGQACPERSRRDGGTNEKIPPHLNPPPQGGRRERTERLFEQKGLGRRLHSKHKRREPDFKKTFLSG
jgi:hypothetical protein